MESKPYLTFNLHDVQYGIDAKLVKEIFLLPELIPIAEAPIDIVGILNLRGKIVPVMHLDLRLGNPMQECKISDSVIVLEWEGLQIGLIVNAVREVTTIDSQLIEHEIDFGRERTINPAFVAGVAKFDEEAIVLLNSEALIRQPDAVEALISDEEFVGNGSDEKNGNGIKSEISEEIDIRKTLTIISSFYDLCCPNATPQERAIFRRRAENLRQANAEAISDVTGQIPLAVVGMGGEYFGVDLNAVREFINVRSFTRVPCCPERIVGNMNLRGEIVTLVDIRSTLNLPATTVNTGAKAVVINVDDIVAGLPVDEVLDVMYLHPETVNPVPVAVPAGSEAYLKGTVAYQEKTLSLIDLPALLEKGGLVVDEKI
jgi:purine-binding chemotaxis protein CheW